MRVTDPFKFVKAINFPKDKKTVEKVHKVLFKTKITRGCKHHWVFDKNYGESFCSKCKLWRHQIEGY